MLVVVVLLLHLRFFKKIKEVTFFFRLIFFLDTFILLLGGTFLFQPFKFVAGWTTLRSVSNKLVL